MQMALVRVPGPVGDCFKIVRATEDLPPVDDVVAGWMLYHCANEGSTITALRCDVDGVNDGPGVWVVTTFSGRVESVSYPPVGRTLPVGPLPVDLVCETA
jgi:hypothetical protein